MVAAVTSQLALYLQKNCSVTFRESVPDILLEPIDTQLEQAFKKIA